MHTKMIFKMGVKHFVRFERFLFHFIWFHFIFLVRNKEKPYQMCHSFRPLNIKKKCMMLRSRKIGIIHNKSIFVDVLSQFCSHFEWEWMMKYISREMGIVGILPFTHTNTHTQKMKRFRWFWLWARFDAVTLLHSILCDLSSSMHFPCWFFIVFMARSHKDNCDICF